jgi:hypothetical protein
MSVKRLTPAIQLYQKYSEGSYDPFKDYRPDLAFNLKNGADIIIEEEGIHTDNPFNLKVSDIADWSRKHENQFADMLLDYNDYVNDTLDSIKRSAKPQYELYGDVDGYDRTEFDSTLIGLTNEEKYTRIIKKCQNRLYQLRKNGDASLNSGEIEHRRQNVFNIRMIQSNYDINHPMQLLYTDKFALTNQVTLLRSVYENGSDENPYSDNIRQYAIGEIIEIAANKNVNTILSKEQRPVVLPLTTGERVIGDQAYLYWSGLQVFDIDLKFSPSFLSSGLSASDARDIIFERLKQYPWLVSVNLSMSKRGIHVWTKVSRMHHLFDDETANINIAKFWYRMSYIQKFAAIAYILENFCKVDLHNELDNKKKVIDAAMAQPRQLAALNYDPEARYNANFIDLYPVIYYHKAPASNIADSDWLTNDKILNRFTSWLNENSDLEYYAKNQTYRSDQLLNINLDTDYLLSDIKQIDVASLPKGDKYKTRYRVANTVMSLYGNTTEAKQLVHHILQSDKTKTTSQINSFINSAVINKKQPDIYMVRTLQKLGLQLSVTEETDANIRERELSIAENTLKNSNYIFTNTQSDVIIRLDEGEYLTDKKHSILKSFDCYKLNLIESPPNTGKTTLFKELAKTHRICMVSPFTSTIESKIVTDASINELFDVYYGDKSITAIKDNPGRSVVMTFDKFSRLTREYYQMFDYIVIDESHLLFTSTYRLEVVSQTVENIREYLLTEAATTKEAFGDLRNNFKNLIGETDSTTAYTTFIMMTGTVTCESDYFNFYNILNYIKISKQHPFAKQANFIFCQTSETKNITIYREIAEAIQNGYKVLHPTNHGDGYAKKVVAAVEYILNRPINYEYYKRANADDDFLKAINTDCSTKEIELLFSTDYLSVGIDIEDRHNFRIIYNNDFTAEDIEQFNNRLRKTDIHCTIVCDVLSDDGFIKPSTLATRQIKYSATKELISVFNDEKTVSKLQQHIHDKQGYYVILGELFSRYFTLGFNGRIKFVKAALEIEQFEKQFSEIAKGLLYIKTALHKKYGYEIDIRTVQEESDLDILMFQQIVSAAYSEYKQNKSDRFIELIKFVATDSAYTVITECSKLKYEQRKIAFDEDKSKLHVGYDSVTSDGTAILSYNREYKYIIDSCIKTALKLRKHYEYSTVCKIIDDCKAGELINYTELNRYVKLMQLLKDDRNHYITNTTKDILEIAYEYIPSAHGKPFKMDKLDYDEMSIKIHTYVHDNIESITGDHLQSDKRLTEINRKITNFIDILFRKRISKDTVSIQFRKIYEFNSDSIMQRLMNDRIFNKIILNEHDAKPEVNMLSEDHITVDPDVDAGRETV